MTLAESNALRARYNVVRRYFNRPGHRRVILRNVDIDTAQAHCRNPETSSSTCTSQVGKARTRKMGAWYDGYEAVR